MFCLQCADVEKSTPHLPWREAPKHFLAEALEAAAQGTSLISSLLRQVFLVSDITELLLLLNVPLLLQ